MWQHGPGELAIASALLFLERWSERRSNRELWLCGACAAAALMIRPTNSLLLPALVAALIATKAASREYMRLLALPVTGGLLAMLFNLYVFGAPSGNQGVEELTTPLLQGLAGIFFSPARGLLNYTPVALFALSAFLPAAALARRRHLALLVASVSFIVLHSIVIAKWRDWWGGYCWGPRLLTEIVPPLVVLMAIGVAAMDRPWMKRAFAALAIYSCLIQAVGAYFYPKGNWDVRPRPAARAEQRLWIWRDNPIRRTVLAGPAWEPYAIVAAALSGGMPEAARRMRELRADPYERE